MLKTSATRAATLAAFAAAGLLAAAGVSVSAQLAPAPPLAPAAPQAASPGLTTLHFINVVACRPKAHSVRSVRRRPLPRRPLMTPAHLYTPIHHSLPHILRARPPVRCEVERRVPLMTAALADATPPAVTLADFAPEPTSVLPSLPIAANARSAAFGTGPMPFSNLPPITGAGRRGLVSVNEVSAAPEPAGWLLMSLGLGAVGMGLRRRRGRDSLAGLHA